MASTTFSKDRGVMKSVSKGILISGSRTSSLSPVSVLGSGFGSKAYLLLMYLVSVLYGMSTSSPFFWWGVLDCIVV